MSSLGAGADIHSVHLGEPPITPKSKFAPIATSGKFRILDLSQVLAGRAWCGRFDIAGKLYALAPSCRDHIPLFSFSAVMACINLWNYRDNGQHPQT
jgi:hypothetical protein